MHSFSSSFSAPDWPPSLARSCTLPDISLHPSSPPLPHCLHSPFPSRIQPSQTGPVSHVPAVMGRYPCHPVKIRYQAPQRKIDVPHSLHPCAHCCPYYVLGVCRKGEELCYKVLLNKRIPSLIYLQIIYDKPKRPILRWGSSACPYVFCHLVPPACSTALAVLPFPWLLGGKDLSCASQAVAQKHRWAQWQGCSAVCPCWHLHLAVPSAVPPAPGNKESLLFVPGGLSLPATAHSHRLLWQFSSDWLPFMPQSVRLGSG